MTILAQLYWPELEAIKQRIEEQKVLVDTLKFKDLWRTC